MINLLVMRSLSTLPSFNFTKVRLHAGYRIRHTQRRKNLQNKKTPAICLLFFIIFFLFKGGIELTLKIFYQELHYSKVKV